nr:YihY/virulence factor BrkB family protein [Candidatus Woesebacteria bacterium]
LFALPPILMIVLMLLSIFLSSANAQHSIIFEVKQIFGEQAMGPIAQILSYIAKPSNREFLPQLVAGIFLFVGIIAIGDHLQRSLNTIWHIAPKKRSLITLIEQRMISVVLIAGAGLLFMTSLAFTTVLQLITPFLERNNYNIPATLEISHLLLSFLITTIVIACVFRVASSGSMKWNDILIGASTTSLLYLLGKYLISLYINTISIASVYGAAGSIIVLLLWIYYSSLIFFFGAEFTYIYSQNHGSGIQNKNP